METAENWASGFTPDRIDGMIFEIASRVGYRSAHETIVKHLGKMRLTTVAYVHRALTLTTPGSAIAAVFDTLIGLEAEESILCHARFHEVYQVPLHARVGKSLMFAYLDAPLTESDEVFAPYVVKAHALCAVANTFNIVTANVDQIPVMEERYAEQISVFLTHPDRALELAHLMSEGTAKTASDLRYYLELHTAINGGAL